MNKVAIYICVAFISAGFLFSETSAEAGEVRGVGYWKNNDEVREYYIASAVSMSLVFDSDSSLRYYLGLKGKKTMEEKAKRELAALLLNIAAGLEITNWLSQGELELIQSFDPIYETGVSIGDAVTEIESAILNLSNLENAKDLADEINGREIFF